MDKIFACKPCIEGMRITHNIKGGYKTEKGTCALCGKRRFVSEYDVLGEKPKGRGRE